MLRCRACDQLTPTSPCPACGGVDLVPTPERMQTPVPIYGAPPMREPASSEPPTTLWQRLTRWFR